MERVKVFGDLSKLNPKKIKIPLESLLLSEE
jgi:hypothetical protein